MNTKFREPFSGFSHIFGAIISLIGLVLLIIAQIHTDNYNTITIISALIFGISLICLYTASGIYHLTIAKDSVIKSLRKLDHAMIFILIAGTYTPVCAVLLDAPLKFIMLGAIWTVALCGIIFKLAWINCPSWLSSAIYIGMGWMAIFIIKPLAYAIPTTGLALLILGGVLYTIGGVIYCLEKKGVTRKFGAHEIFHIFVILGSLAHYIFIFKYVFNL